MSGLLGFDHPDIDDDGELNVEWYPLPDAFVEVSDEMDAEYSESSMKGKESTMKHRKAQCKSACGCNEEVSQEFLAPPVQMSMPMSEEEEEAEALAMLAGQLSAVADSLFELAEHEAGGTSLLARVTGPGAQLGIVVASRSWLLQEKKVMPDSSRIGRGVSDRIASRYAMEFPTQEAFDAYLKKHPGAKKENHTVKDNAENPSESREEKVRRVQGVIDATTKKLLPSVEKALGDVSVGEIRDRGDVYVIDLTAEDGDQFSVHADKGTGGIQDVYVFSRSQGSVGAARVKLFGIFGKLKNEDQISKAVSKAREEARAEAHDRKKMLAPSTLHSATRRRLFSGDKIRFESPDSFRNVTSDPQVYDSYIVHHANPANVRSLAIQALAELKRSGKSLSRAGEVTRFVDEYVSEKSGGKIRQVRWNMKSYPD